MRASFQVIEGKRSSVQIASNTHAPLQHGQGWPERKLLLTLLTEQFLDAVIDVIHIETPQMPFCSASVFYILKEMFASDGEGLITSSAMLEAQVSNLSARHASAKLTISLALRVHPFLWLSCPTACV